jgi:4-diphosphocytidyl-2-C-methyl-D-erythritol kinase
MPTTVRSYSKINLGLAIGPSRPDGFHSLTTLYQTLDAHDLVTLEARPAAATSITLTSNDARVPADSRNTAWKAVELALASLKRSAEVTIHIEKRLPVQGGLGAGSANAAAALIALAGELRKHGIAPLSGPEKLHIAAQVGSDVPLFLIGGSVLGLGHGEEVYPLPDLQPTHCVLALSEIGVSTPQAFRDWDALHSIAALERNTDRDMAAPFASWNVGPGHAAPGITKSGDKDSLTPEPSSATLKTLSQVLASAFCEPHSSGIFSNEKDLAGNFLSALVRTGIENDFEEVVFPKYPLLGQIKRALTDSDHTEHAAIYAALSGSGSALFGLYGTAEAADAAEARLATLGVRSLRTKTLPREAYWRTMLVE